LRENRHGCDFTGSGLPIQLAVEHEREVAITDDVRSRKVTFVGPIKIELGNRLCHTGALVLVEKVLLGVLLYNRF
jgi:hypothetical protein